MLEPFLHAAATQGELV